MHTLFGYSPRILAGIAEWGNVLGLIGVMSICSVQLVSRWGAFILSTSTLSERCSKGQANVSDGNAYNRIILMIHDAYILNCEFYLIKVKMWNDGMFHTSITCNHESKLKSESLKSDGLKTFVNFIFCMLDVWEPFIDAFVGPPVAFCWQKSTHDS